MLLLNPQEVGGRLQGRDPGSAERRGGAGGDVLAEARPLKGNGARFEEGGRDFGEEGRRVHILYRTFPTGLREPEMICARTGV